MRIHVCMVRENGTTRALPKTAEEMRIYVVTGASALILPPTNGRGPAPDRAEPGDSARLAAETSPFL